MPKKNTTFMAGLAIFAAALAAYAQNEGHVNYLQYGQSDFDPYTSNPSAATEQWFRTHLSSMVVWSPYFDVKTSWFPKASVYLDLYAITQGSALQFNHPEWILHDQYGNWLYVPFDCGSGTCPQWAGDIANPAFRSYWISEAKLTVAKGGYAGFYIDDVNMLFRVTDAYYNQIAPIDSNTGQPMAYNTWKGYVAQFLEQIRLAFPSTPIIENAIWFAGGADDPYVQRQWATATKVNLERGIASDPGLTGGIGFWSVYNFFNYVDAIHAAGASVNFGEYSLDTDGQEYGLASYFLISNGRDSLGDGTVNPTNWFSGYDVDLGIALGPRSYAHGLFQRNFTGGLVLLAEPGLGATTVVLPRTFQNIRGTSVNSVTLSGSQGVILIGSTAGSSANVNHFVSDLTPTSVFNGWGSLQRDTSILGHPLSLVGTLYTKGLGAHATSEIHYSLSALAGCSQFSAVVGIDDEVPSGYGWATFQVFGDNTELFDSGYLRNGGPPATVNVNVSGFQNLVLLVRPPTSDVSWDHADWANPILTCIK